jgi:uncharacterized damage-inducible protein DinB
MNPRVQLILDELFRHRHQFEAFCRALGDDELAAPIPASTWTVKDYIAHLATIDGLIAHNFQAVAGVSDVPPIDIPAAQPFDIDDWNEAAIAARKPASIEQLLAEAAAHRADLVRVFAAVDDARLDMQIPFGSRRASGLPDAPVKLREVMWAIAVHDPNHTQDILRALPGRAETPFVAEWLASAHVTEIAPEIALRRA